MTWIARLASLQGWRRSKLPTVCKDRSPDPCPHRYL